MGSTSLLLGGRYRLDRLIASGEDTEVWEGTDEVLARPVAVKVLRPHAPQPGGGERFCRDAAAAARLAHPGIVGIYDARVDGAGAYIVMELVRGTDLRRLLADRGGRLPARVAVAIAVDVADALDHAHRAGIAHRDLRLGTILCDGDRAKIADFGMAPATANGDADPRGTDVYGLGVVLYEMVCGRPPDADAPLRPRQVTAGVPRALEAVILRAIAPDRARRFESAADLRAALLSVDLADDAVPLVARDDTPPEGITPSFRQSERSWLVPASAILLVAAALVAVGVLFAGTDVGRDLLRRDGGGEATPTAAAPLSALEVVSADAFDPLGDGAEHDDDASLVTDGSPATAWTTSSYSRADFGGLKEGVGVVLQLDRPGAIRRIEVESPAPGWQADVYVAGATSTSFPGGWGPPVVSLAGTRELVAADLPEGVRGGAVLLWLTALPRDGGGFRGVVAELRLLA